MREAPQPIWRQKPSVKHDLALEGSWFKILNKTKMPSHGMTANLTVKFILFLAIIIKHQGFFFFFLIRTDNSIKIAKQKYLTCSLLRFFPEKQKSLCFFFLRNKNHNF